VIEFSKPSVEYSLIWPMLLIFGVACAGVLVEAFVPRAWRYLTQTVLAGGGVLAAFVGVIMVANDLDSHNDGAARGKLVVEGSMAIDGPTVFLWGLILLLSFAGVLLFAVGGMMMFPAASDLLTLFVALEVLSLPLYLLSGLARRRRLLSQEAAMKYFLLGAFSSGFFIYGIALVYGYAGSMQFSAIDVAIRNSDSNHSLLMIGMGMVTVGLLFKVSAVPFQAWTPDVYQGAPTAVTAFMSAATKVAAFGAILRLFYVAFGTERWSWQPLFWVIAVLTMVVGSVLAIAQTDVKRMLAYSSVAHTGFLLTGVLGVTAAADKLPGEITSLQAVLFYLTTYGFLTLSAFAVVSVVRDSSGEITHLRRWAGLGRTAPLVAGAFALFLLGMAGIPLTSGFTGKWAVFAAAGSAGAWPVVVIAVLASAHAASFYLRVIVLMYFTAPIGDGPSVTMPSLLTSATIALGVGATVYLGLIPGPVLDLAGRAGEFIK
jgi:NADH-quinone oxidoreductase subunit N